VLLDVHDSFCQEVCSVICSLFFEISSLMLHEAGMQVEHIIQHSICTLVWCIDGVLMLLFARVAELGKLSDPFLLSFLTPYLLSGSSS
jgi:hypothetical protein